MMRVCSDLLHAFFSLQRIVIKKEGTPSWQVVCSPSRGQ